MASLSTNAVRLGQAVSLAGLLLIGIPPEAGRSASDQGETPAAPAPKEKKEKKKEPPRKDAPAETPAPPEPDPGPIPWTPVKKDGKRGYIDETGKMMIEVDVDRSGYFTEGLAPARKEEKWGFINKKGEFVIPPSFDSVTDFSQGLAFATNAAHRKHFIDRSGKLAFEVPVPTVNVGNFTPDGLALIRLNEDRDHMRFAYLDRKGNLAFEAKFDFAHPFREGLALVSPDQNKWGYINSKGEFAIEAKFRSAGEFHEGMAWVSEDNMGWRYIDASGKVVLERAGMNDFSHGLAFSRGGDFFGFMNKEGKTVIKPEFMLAQEFSEGRAWVQAVQHVSWNKANYPWGCIDVEGRFVIKPDMKYVKVNPFRCGLSPVEFEDETWGYLDKTGKMVWGPIEKTSPTK